MKRKLLKPLLGCLLVAALLACAKTEEVAAQEEGKTAKDLLCRKWRLTDRLYNNPYLYTNKDTFGITFYEDYTFVFRTDPEWYLHADSLYIKGKEETLIIQGKWKFLYFPDKWPAPNPNPTEQICEETPCLSMPILLEANINSDVTRNLARLFNSKDGNVSVQYLTKDSICIVSPSPMLRPLILRLKSN